MTFIVAEAGVNHNGSVEEALKMCAVARDAGCDAIKFQTFRAEAVVTASAGKAHYQQSNTGEGTQLEMIRALELPWTAFIALEGECRRLGITFFSTALDLDSLTGLEALGVSMHKIPSGEITNLPFLRQLGSYGKPVLLSSGMSTLGEIESAIEILELAGTPRQEITVLHCNTEYPTPMGDVNLRAMLSIRDAFGVAVGYRSYAGK